MFKVTPKKTLHGKKLKMFYCIHSSIVSGGYGVLPITWYDRLPVEVTQEQLNDLMDSLVRRGHP